MALFIVTDLLAAPIPDGLTPLLWLPCSLSLWSSLCGRAVTRKRQPFTDYEVTLEVLPFLPRAQRTKQGDMVFLARRAILARAHCRTTKVTMNLTASSYDPRSPAFPAMA